MKKVNTAHWKIDLLSLCFAISTAAGTALGQDSAALAPGFIGEKGGRGDWPAVAQSRADLRTHTLYRPVSLPAEPLPLLIWGNGGCSDKCDNGDHASNPATIGASPNLTRLREVECPRNFGEPEP